MIKSFDGLKRNFQQQPLSFLPVSNFNDDNDVTDDNFNDDVSIVDVNVASNVGSCSRLNFFHSSVRSRFREVA